jgi:hypothetical protein
VSDSNLPARLGRVPLWKEITIILVIKAAALCLIWLVYFSAPADKGPDAAGIASSLLGTEPQPVHPPSQPETGHAARPGTR